MGLVFDEKYRVQRTLGQGTQGRVIRAQDVALDRPVALKFMNEELLSNPDVRAQFMTEAQTMARVRHPNVVEIYGLPEHDGVPYLVMEYVDGPTLEQYAEQRGGLPLSIDEVLGVLDQACRGVQAIHDAGALHRDIKPGNILIGPAFRVAITDLGLARSVENLQARAAVGTLGYMPPEAIRGELLAPDLAPRSDVYSLAALTYELLTGRLPFTGDTAIELIQNQLRAFALPPSELAPWLPTLLDAVIMQALDPDPTRRTASAEEFRSALMRARARAKLPTAMQRTVVVIDPDESLHDWYRDAVDEALPLSDVICVTSADAGVRAIAEFEPDLILSELTLPDADAYALIEHLNADGVDAPMVVLAEFGGAMDWRQLQVLGVEGFFLKPCVEDALISIARRLVPA